MTITPALIKALREQTGAGFADVKNALTEANGDMEQATVILRKKGLAAAGKKAGRVTAEGTIAAHVAGDKGVLVEVNCETDFVGRNEHFRNFAQQVAETIAQSKAETVEELLAENWPGTSEPVSQKVAEQIASIKENISIRASPVTKRRPTRPSVPTSTAAARSASWWKWSPRAATRTPPWTRCRRTSPCTSPRPSRASSAAKT